jgi:hypothetical protein
MLGHVEVKRVKGQRVQVGGIPTFSSPLEEESEYGERGESDDTSDNTCHEQIGCGLFHGDQNMPHTRDVG